MYFPTKVRFKNGSDIFQKNMSIQCVTPVTVKKTLNINSNTHTERKARWTCP